ncbi:MAG: hypothetical protein AB8B91_09070 [Rubripirellula sp.]
MDGEKIKQFMLYNFEKLILVFVIAGSGFLVYQGMQLPNFLQEEQPDRLAQRATQAKSDIDLDHSDAIIPERIPDFDIWGKTNELYDPVDGTAYKLPKTWDDVSARSVVRRQDPQLFPPRALIASSVVTTIAVQNKSGDPEGYFLASLEDADPVEVVEKKAPRKKRSRGRGMGMDEEMMGMGDMEMEMDMEMMGMGMGMDTGMGELSAGAGRRFDSKKDFGYRPPPAGTNEKRPPMPSVSWFVAGRAVVPHKELYESYEMALKDAEGYMPIRDTPVYFNMEVQRADVTTKKVEDVAEADWVNIWDRLRYTKLAAQMWSGFAPEIVPDDYRHEAFSLWIPPVLLDDYASFATHPQVPMISQKELNMLLNSEVEVDNGPGDFSLEDDEDDGTSLVGPGQTGNMGGEGYEDMGMGMEMDMEMDMGMGMGGMAFGRGQVEKDPVDFKLARFYDLVGTWKNAARAGRTYVYRIRYSVSDPNFPASRVLQPKTGNLAPEVIDRVQKLMAQAGETQKRSYERWSDWSAPSEPVVLAAPEQQFAGPITPGTTNMWQVQGKTIPYRRDPPKGKMIASQFVESIGTRIPLAMDVTEGTVLSHKVESADVVDPITLKVKKLPDAEIVSGTTIVSLDGGSKLQITDDLTEPGMMLMFNPLGGLKVTDDIDGQEFYRIYNYSDEKGE